jgi:hypothetical protein
MRRAIIVVAVGLTIASAANAAEIDSTVIAKITALQPEVKNGVAKITVPRTDLAVTVDGAKMQPFQGFTSWAAFTQSGSHTIVMGDLTLAEDEVSPVMSAALDGGLEVTALHNHFAFDHPRIMFMHIAGTGTTEQLATAVKKALDAAKEARKTPAPAESFGGPAIPATNSIDPKPLESIFNVPGQAKEGMVKFVFARTTKAHGTTLGADMGVNTWAAFAGSPDTAVVDGDFAMLESELQTVLKTLRGKGMNIVAIHSHMTHEEPRILFLHYWGKGPATDLARAIKAALDTQHE